MSDARAVDALRGALGFLSRLPVGRDERAWEAFRGAPWTLPVAGAVLGGLLAAVVGLALVAAVPAPTVALASVVAVVALTGINHADGLADLGDAVVVHGDAERRRAVMDDTVTGVGGTLALVTVVAGLALAGLGLAGLPVTVAAGLVVASEVAAKLAMVVLMALGTPAHEGFGAAVAGDLEGTDVLLPAALALPVVLAPGVVGAAAVAGALGVALAVLWWTRRNLGGVTGDVFGAGNELARVGALHAGLVAWGAVGAGSPFDLVALLGEVVAWTPW